MCGCDPGLCAGVVIEAQQDSCSSPHEIVKVVRDSPLRTVVVSAQCILT